MVSVLTMLFRKEDTPQFDALFVPNLEVSSMSAKCIFMTITNKQSKTTKLLLKDGDGMQLGTNYLICTS